MAIFDEKIEIRERWELSNAYLLAKIGFDTAENEPLEVWGKNSIQYSLHSLLLNPAKRGVSTGCRPNDESLPTREKLLVIIEASRVKNCGFQIVEGFFIHGRCVKFSGTLECRHVGVGALQEGHHRSGGLAREVEEVGARRLGEVLEEP